VTDLPNYQVKSRLRIKCRVLIIREWGNEVDFNECLRNRQILRTNHPKYIKIIVTFSNKILRSGRHFLKPDCCSVSVQNVEIV
jgi:hypothetical protein